MRVRGKPLVLSVIAFILLAVGTTAFLIWGRPHGPTPEGQPTPRPEGAGWVDLLDGDRETGWKNISDDSNIFGISDGVLHIYGRSLLSLRYVGYAPENFENFDLHLEFKVARRANSGVFLRAQPEDPVGRGFEVQVVDDHGSEPSKHGCGAVYDVVTPMFNMSRPRGEWNSLDITAEGTHIVVVMNGWKVVDTDFALMTKPLGKFKTAYNDLPLSGMLALQDHGGEVWYRNILVRKR